MQDYTIREAQEKDRTAVTDTYNYFVENTQAAYPDTKVDYNFFARMKSMCWGGAFYVIQLEISTVVGFGVLRHHQRMNTFDRSAELTYFILPDHSRKGLGSRLIEKLEENARTMGVETLLAGMSSLNKAGVAFHLKNGFKECGRFERVGRKFGQDFDEVWMQKSIK